MKKYICLLAILFTGASVAYPKSGVQFKKEIEKSSKSLVELQKNIKEKRLEKEKCLLDEKCIARELQKIDKELTRLQSKGASLKKEINKSEKKLNQYEKELKLAGWEKQQWINSHNLELNAWFRARQSYKSLFHDKIAEHMRFQALKQKRSYVGNAQQKESMSRQAILKWQAAKDKLGSLKKQQELTLHEQEGVKGEKKNILNTTVGKRLAAEYEIKKLTESARELENLIVKLEKEKKNTELEAQERRKFKERKRQLPWPVEGEIVLRFGKNKHPELDTYVISNGIKIKGARSAEVKAVNKGEVLFCGEFRSYGQMIIIDHNGGFYTIYGQLNEILVTEGQKVQAGALIGKLGDGRDAQPVLYFEVRSENQVEDPELWLK